MSVFILGLVVSGMGLWAGFWIARRCGLLGFLIEQAVWFLPNGVGEVLSTRLEAERKHAAEERRKGKE